MDNSKLYLHLMYMIDHLGDSNTLPCI